ncbi:probable serine/threonine-protein kinase At1g01540, partial [Phalaenopsis equestris]
MPFWNTTFLTNDLSKQTAIFGIRLYIFIGICVGAAIVLVLFLLSLCFLFRHRSRSLPPPSSYSSSRKPLKLFLRDFTPPISKEILDIVRHRPANSAAAPPIAQIEVSFRKDDQIGLISDHQRSNASGKSIRGAADRLAFVKGLVRPPDVSHLGWGYWYTLRELEMAAGGFADENVIGEGGYGIVYRGVLDDGSIVAIKNLLNN